MNLIKEKHAENVAELFFLQTGGNMMDYLYWRKKQPTAPFINFNKQYKLESGSNSEEVDQLSKANVQIQPIPTSETTTNITTRS